MQFVNVVLHYTALLHGDRFALAMRIPLMQFANAAPHCTTRLCGDHAIKDIKNIGIIAANQTPRSEARPQLRKALPVWQPRSPPCDTRTVV
jgi:hypothetical protein